MSEQFLYFLQQMFNGVTLGSTYALIAIGYTMVYGIIGMINFAHGEVYMIGSYVSFMIIAALMMMGIDTSWLLVAAGFIGAIIIASAYGWSIERVAYRPVRNSKRLIALISAIGMSIFLQNYVSLTEGSRDVALPSLFNGQWIVGSSENFAASITTMQAVIWIVTFLAMLALTIFIRYSRMGRACRACAEDLKMASLLGINTDRVIALTFVIGAAMAAVAGVLLGQFYGVINPYIGFMAGMKAFTAAVLGGIGSIPGAMIGGLILGVAEALSSAYLSTEYKDVVSFALLILVLLVMPTGRKYETDAYCDGAILCGDVLRSGWRLHGRTTGAGRHQTGGGYRRRHPLAVDLYRYGSGFFLSVVASDVPESGEACLRTEVYSAGDRWLYR